jgi:hypothetical protein
MDMANITHVCPPPAAPQVPFSRLSALEHVVAVARLVAKYDFPHDINRLRAALAALDAQEPKP